jgi:hypothetical protein
VFDLVPVAGSRRKMRHLDMQAGEASLNRLFMRGPLEQLSRMAELVLQRWSKVTKRKRSAVSRRRPLPQAPGQPKQIRRHQLGDVYPNLPPIGERPVCAADDETRNVLSIRRRPGNDHL